MDPLSLSLGIAGLLPLIAKAINFAKDYRNSVNAARESIAILISELEALQVNVTNLHDFLKCDALGGANFRFHHTSVLLTCSRACGAKLQSLCRKLGEEPSGRRSRYLWPFTEKEHQKTIEGLRNFANWMHFALSVDGCRLLARTSDDVLKLLEQQLQQFRALESLEDTTARIYSTVQGQKHMLEDSLSQSTRKKILEWISTAIYYQKHHALQASRAKDSGGWILRNSEYSRWRDGSEASGILWCYGIQGSGKTNLVSTIIDDLLKQGPGSPLPVAFFYFDHQDRSSQSTSAFFSSILRQLLDLIPELPNSVSAAYENTHARGPLPQFECERLIEELVRELGHVYLVIDALDECASEHRTSVLHTLARLSNAQEVRLLVTSRPHTHDVATTFAHYPSLKISAQENDIRLYLLQELGLNGVCDAVDEEFTGKLVDKLINGAAGMFLLPVLQLRTVLKEPTLGEMEDRLNNLSENLTEVFGQTISRIKTLPASKRRIGMSSLMYLTHAVRPMSIYELSDLLSLHPGRRSISPKYRPSQRMILECCQGLITVDAETRDVRVAHHAIQEYLTRHASPLFPQAAGAFAVACLRYLLLDDFTGGPRLTRHGVGLWSDNYPFLRYATCNWGKHVGTSEGDTEVQAALNEFFASTNAMAVANQVRQYTIGRIERYWGAEECLSFTSLHHACREGLAQDVVRILDQKILDVNVATKEGSTPVIHAAANGHVNVVGILMQRGANPYLCNWYGNALHCAVDIGHPSTVRELIVRWGMDPNDIADYERTYLDCALYRDCAGTFETLVDLGVDIGSTATWTQMRFDLGYRPHIFLEACSLPCYQIVDLMVNRGWVDVNMGLADGRTALYLASLTRHWPTVKRLVDAGANIYAKTEQGVSCLDVLQRLFPKTALEYIRASNTTNWRNQRASQSEPMGSPRLSAH